jgi:hypothetical protein
MQRVVKQAGIPASELLPRYYSALRARFGQNFAWFRKGGNEYIVTDAGILAELQQADEPQNQVNRMQSDGGKPGQPELRDFSDFSSLPRREANKIAQFRMSRIPLRIHGTIGAG